MRSPFLRGLLLVALLLAATVHPSAVARADSVPDQPQPPPPLPVTPPESVAPVTGDYAGVLIETLLFVYPL